MMNKESFSRFLGYIILYVLFIVTQSQEIDENKYSITGHNGERCENFRDTLRRYNRLENIINGLKSNCHEGYNVFSQDIFGNPLKINKACTFKNSNKIMRRLEYLENLISRISEYCKTDENSTATTQATPAKPSTRTEVADDLSSSTLRRTTMTEAESTQSTTQISSSTATSTGTTLSNTIVTVSTTKRTTTGSSGIPAIEASTLPPITNSTKTFLVATLLINAIALSNVDVPFVWSRCYFKIKVFDGYLQITNFNVTVIYRTDLISNTVARFQEHFIYKDEVISAICTDEIPLQAYIGVKRYGKNIHLDTDNSGLSSLAKSHINYLIMEDGRTVSAEMHMSNSGPFRDSMSGSFQNKFHYKLESNDFSLKVLNASMEEAVLNNFPGQEVWYPPLNSFLASDLIYKTCFIKIGTLNASSNLLIRVISRNDNSTLLGIHEKGLTDGAACIEYRCSVQNPDFSRINSFDFYRYAKSYTLVKIIPVGQVCMVSSESSQLRLQEQINLGLSSPRTNVGNTFFEGNIPDIEYEGIFFHKSNSFERIPDAQEKAIRECNTGVHSSFSATEEDMTPNVGLAIRITCL